MIARPPTLNAPPHPSTRLSRCRQRARAFIGLLWLTSALTGLAFPPAPHHILFGMIRTEWGDPLDVTGAEVFIESDNAVGERAFVVASTDPGVNYIMRLPMDSGTTLDLYQTTAMRPDQLFLLKVSIGGTIYLPIEMALGSAQLGQPAGSTRLDLTLGEDSDGDGLPDSWEQAIIAMLGGTLAGITPDGDADGDGLSNRDEYVAGTYAFDPNDGFRVELQRVEERSSFLEFLVLRGRTYSLQASDNLKDWSPVPFHLVDGGAAGPPVTQYQSVDVRMLQVEVIGAPDIPFRYFKAVVQ